MRKKSPFFVKISRGEGRLPPCGTILRNPRFEETAGAPGGGWGQGLHNRDKQSAHPTTPPTIAKEGGELNSRKDEFPNIFFPPFSTALYQENLTGKHTKNTPNYLEKKIM